MMWVTKTAALTSLGIVCHQVLFEQVSAFQVLHRRSSATKGTQPLFLSPPNHDDVFSGVAVESEVASEELVSSGKPTNDVVAQEAQSPGTDEETVTAKDASDILIPNDDDEAVMTTAAAPKEEEMTELELQLIKGQDEHEEALVAAAEAAIVEEDVSNDSQAALLAAQLQRDALAAAKEAAEAVEHLMFITDEIEDDNDEGVLDVADEIVTEKEIVEEKGDIPTYDEENVIVSEDEIILSAEVEAKEEEATAPKTKNTGFFMMDKDDAPMKETSANNELLEATELLEEAFQLLESTEDATSSSADVLQAVELLKGDVSPKKPIVPAVPPPLELLEKNDAKGFVQAVGKAAADVSKAPHYFLKAYEENQAAKELVEAVGGATLDVSKQILSALRWGAANALTSSLPKDQQQQLLERVSVDVVPTEGVNDEDDSMTEERGSIREEMAAIALEESRKDEERWEKEKEILAKQMEVAAKERMENELAIQRKRLEEEQEMKLRDLMAEAEQWETEREELIQKMEEKAKLRIEFELNLQKSQLDAEQDARVMEIQQEVELLRKERANLIDASRTPKLQDMLDMNTQILKRKEQERALDELEKNLREKIEAIEQEKAKIEEMQAEVEEQARVAQEQAETHAKDAIPVYSPDEYLAMSSEELKSLDKLRSTVQPASDEADADVDEDEGIHPVLGPVVFDMGYKRIHFVSSGKLGTIPVWNKNRVYRHSRAKVMAADKSKSMPFGFPGVICLHEDTKGKLSIIDGQHRVGMMANLREQRKKESEDPTLEDDYMFDNVLVEVYTEPEVEGSVDSGGKNKHAEALFLEINKAEPIQLVDMPGVASAEDRKIITDAVSFLEEQYRPVFSQSQRCVIGSVNMDNLRNGIFGANVLKRHNIKSSKELYDWLMVQNASLGEKYVTNKREQIKLVGKKAYRKATSNDFYLGLESSWMYK